MFSSLNQVLHLHWRLFSFACRLMYFTQFLDHSDSISASEEQIYINLYFWIRLSSLTDSMLKPSFSESNDKVKTSGSAGFQVK